MGQTVTGVRRTSLLVAIALAISAPAAGAAEEPPQPQFVDVAHEAGLLVTTVSGTATKDHIIDSSTGGVAVFDYDNDGDVDIFVVNGSRLGGFPAGQEPRAALYRNDGDWRFAETAATAGVDHVGWGMGATTADYDADGWVDLYLTNYGPNALYRNEAGQFTDVAAAAGVDHPGWGMSSTFADFDRDGDLDLYVTNYIEFDPDFVPENENFCRWRGLDVFCGPLGLEGAADLYFRNEGAGGGWTFTEAGDAVGLGGVEFYGYQAMTGDFDDDGDADLYVANDATPNLLYLNDGGRFRDVGTISSTAYSENGLEQASMGVASGDYDGDGDLDLFVTNFSYDNNTLYRNAGRGFFVDASFAAGLGAPSHRYLGWGAGFFDSDNDGIEDLFVANGHVYPAVDAHTIGTRYAQPNQLFRGDGKGRFADVSARAGPGLAIEESSRGAAFGDFDDDGDQDIVVVNIDSRPSLLRNDGGNRRNWLMVRLRDTGANVGAIGARVTVTTAGRRQMREMRAGTSYLSQDDMRLHFGLGDQPVAEQVVIRWPHGDEEVLTEVAANQLITVRRGSGIVPRGFGP